MRRRLHLSSLLALALGVTTPLSAVSSETLQTPGGEVISLRPDGREWSCGPLRCTGDGFTLFELRCRRPFGDVALLLYAKDYQGPSETVGGICARDWKAYYRSILPSITRLDARVVSAGPRPVCVVDAEELSGDGARLRLREWWSIAPGHVLLVTAAGPAALVAAQGQAISRWYDGVVFRAATPSK